MLEFHRLAIDDQAARGELRGDAVPQGENRHRPAGAAPELEIVKNQAVPGADRSATILSQPYHSRKLPGGCGVLEQPLMCRGAANDA
jgi:hypothetical protein